MIIKTNILHKTLLLGASLTFGLSSFAGAKSKSTKTLNFKDKKASSFPSTVNNPQPGEIIFKCAGVAKKGENHCGANGHNCTGKSADDDSIKDFDKNEWVYLRDVDCNKKEGNMIGGKKVIKG